MDKKTKKITIEVTLLEHKKLKADSSSQGMLFSAWCRRVFVRGMKEAEK